MYTVEHDVPMPPRRGREQSELRRAMAAMKVGDSILVPKYDEHKYSGACGHLRRLGIKFTRRTVDDRTFRAWRTK